MPIDLNKWAEDYPARCCPWCGGENVQRADKRITITWECPDCRNRFILHPVLDNVEKSE